MAHVASKRSSLFLWCFLDVGLFRVLGKIECRRALNPTPSAGAVRLRVLGLNVLRVT